MRYSAKQCELLAMFKRQKLKRLNILVGSVRSGKTWISLVLWAFWILTMPKSGAYLMVAKTLTSLKRNCLDLLETLVGKSNFTYSLSQKEGQLFGRTIYLEGVNDARAESKIRGMTLQGAYCDELTLFTEDFFAMLLSRLSESGAKLFATTNPDNPNHWVKLNYIDRQNELDMLVMQFLIDDNVFLDPEYIKQLKREYVGVFYQRYILGVWIPAEGIIYRPFADDPARYLANSQELPRLMEVNAAFDPGGTSSNHAFSATGITPGYKHLIALRSERHKAEGTTPKDIDRMAVEFVGKVISKYGRCDNLFWDNEAAVLGRGIKEAVETAYPQVSVRPCYKGTIKNRIDFMCRLLGLDRFKYTEDCNTLKEALEQAVWDSKHDDERLDDGSTPIDDLDAFEYTFTPYMAYFISN